MKVVVSSKSLASTLNKLDAQNNRVQEVRVSKDWLYIRTDTNSHCVNVGANESNATIEQVDARWDWVQQLVNAVGDQPIVLDIHRKGVNVIFQY